MINSYNRPKTAASGYTKKPVVTWTNFDVATYQLKYDSNKVVVLHVSFSGLGDVMANTKSAVMPVLQTFFLPLQMQTS